ncbi:metallophosphoesterase [Conexibacter sp. CPCC 206217]|uniref:metallophosphoesterase family protein n=1 Tax=Conexibacter sp. CPCC 206217 TaxID=3064574 RepID=UPI00271D7E25|nr:metallophosphoesterase [Conexibacter sp. CPCC 206217]MDO8210187.1 metallophosphoesterase [Conexibacter sp. CPCC 206217]
MTLFKRRRERGMRIFFATDVHGSEQCFRKWLNAREAYEADVLILGGDVTGKGLVPIIDHGSSWTAVVRGVSETASTAGELAELQRKIRMMGLYDLVVQADEQAAMDADPELLKTRFEAAMRDSLRRWTELAAERLPDGYPAYMMLGNDDYTVFEEVLREADAIRYAEDGIHALPDGCQLVSLGYSNPTPWRTPRELTETEITRRLEERLREVADPRRVVLNVHCPPHDTKLDRAPLLDELMRPIVGGDGGVELGPVGSSGTREVIERWQPAVGLHGHVHECAAGDQLGRTLCVNPGSDYPVGALRGAIIEIDRQGEVLRWQLTQG